MKSYFEFSFVRLGRNMSRDRCSIIRVSSLLRAADTENQIESSELDLRLFFDRRIDRTRLQENTRSIESRARIISSRRSVSFSNTCPLRRHIPWTNTAVSLDAFAIRIEPAGTIFNETSVTFAYRDIQFCEAAKNKGSRKEEGAEVAVTR